MRNVTVTLEEDTLQWARLEAARQGTSVSRLLGHLLRERMRREQGYEAAKRQFLSREPKPLKSEGDTYPSRDALHER